MVNFNEDSLLALAPLEKRKRGGGVEKKEKKSIIYSRGQFTNGVIIPIVDTCHRNEVGCGST